MSSFPAAAASEGVRGPEAHLLCLHTEQENADIQSDGKLKVQNIRVFVIKTFSLSHLKTGL